VKVLFVGEGPHDVGRPREVEGAPTVAGGVVTILSRRARPDVDAESIALRWTELRRFHPDARRKGFARKVPVAALIGSRRFDCDAVVCIADQDGDEDRIDQLREGARRARDSVGCGVAVGVAVQAIEAWTLGAAEALAAELETPVADVIAAFPRGVHVEALNERSGKDDHRPRTLLARIAALADRSDNQLLRDAVAERTDSRRLEEKCPAGFAPFAAELRALDQATEAGD